MSKVDELMLIFDTAYCDNLENPETLISSDRAGIIAVVTALRDEFTKLGVLEFQDSWTVLHKFNDILGDAGATTTNTIPSQGETDGNKQDKQEQHFPQGLQAVDGTGAETVKRCERCGGSLTRRDQSQLAFEGAILGDYETRRGRDVGGESNHRLNEKVVGGRGENPDVSGSDLLQTLVVPTTDPAPDVCEWRVHHETRSGPLYVMGCNGGWRHATADPRCPSCGKPIKFKV